MDEKIFFILYNFAQKNRCFGGIVTFSTKASSKIFFVVYIALLVYLVVAQDDIQKLIICVVVPLIALFVTLLVRKLVRRPRPYQTFDIDICVEQKEKFSFPSNHSASAGIIAITCLYCYTPLGILMCILALFTGISRVFSGMHYPTDVLAGFILSSVIGLLYIFL